MRSCCQAHYVLRVAGVYGPPGRYTNRGNFPEYVLRKCAEGGPLRIVNDQFATPTFGPALAARSIQILERQVPFGLYHLSGGESISWFDFARKIGLAAGCPIEVLPISSDAYRARARRPRYAALSNARIEAAGIPRMPGIDSALRQYLTMRGRERPPEGGTWHRH